ncbi:MAG: hypothetical protein KF760_04585 [Candidatus Eremiobacteraeota bacterium]|nr:hypothetical protein [Candidatus Eremiobacteraeota bacterium]MCW5866950.1 hypothetical protein [Candidatus Eremiobacteraeota bacterium]
MQIQSNSTQNRIQNARTTQAPVEIESFQDGYAGSVDSSDAYKGNPALQSHRSDMSASGGEILLYGLAGVGVFVLCCGAGSAGR